MTARRTLPLLALAALVPVLDLLFAAPQERKPRKVAFLVGVGKFQHDLPNLNGSPQKDAGALETALKQNGFEVVKLTDERATKKAVESRFRSLLDGGGDPARALGQGDVLLVAMCSHGFTFETTDPATRAKKSEPFVAGYDAVPGESGNMISLNGLIETGKPFGATKLFLIDACREVPPDLNRGQARGIEGTQMALPKRTAVLFACGQGQLSHQSEKADGGHGLFTYAVLKTLKGGGRVTWTRLVGGVEEAFDGDEIKAMLPKGKAQLPVEAKGEMGATELVAAKPDAAGDTTKRELKGGDQVPFEIAGGVRMVFCWIPPSQGKVILGSPKEEKIRTTGEDNREYATTGFWMGKYEVTQHEWQKVMDKTPSAFASTGAKEDLRKRVAGLDTSTFPVESVSWNDICGKGGAGGADSFLGRLNARPGARAAFGVAGTFALPTEDEWEYAARGGHKDRRPFYWGATANGTEANVNGLSPYVTTVPGPSLRRPTPVGSFEGKARHPWGLCDMHGNVWEWCDSKLDQSSERRVTRGGSWDTDAGYCRAALRCYDTDPDFRNEVIGFRVAYRPN